MYGVLFDGERKERVCSTGLVSAFPKLFQPCSIST